MKLGGNLQLFHTVTGLKKNNVTGHWLLTVKKNDLGAKQAQVRAKFVFCGAGGWALHLLQASGIPEIRGFMGFPISGEFLVCQNPVVVDKHPAKVYGKAAIGAPPMSVPHLDKRIIGGKHMLLFGPFAGFSPRYLKTGSLLDLFKSIRPHNLIPAAAAGLQNLDLTVNLGKRRGGPPPDRGRPQPGVMPARKGAAVRALRARIRTMISALLSLRSRL